MFANTPSVCNRNIAWCLFDCILTKPWDFVSFTGLHRQGQKQEAAPVDSPPQPPQRQYATHKLQIATLRPLFVKKVPTALDLTGVFTQRRLGAG